MLVTPAATVNGVCTVELNPAPDTVIPDTLTLTVLGFFSVKFCEELLPTRIFPNETEEGETFSVATVGATAVPCTPTTVGVELALLVIVAVPFTVPAACGANVTVTVRLEPAVIVNGKVSGLIEKPAPDRVTPDTTRSAVPEFVIVTVWLLVVPTVTLVKLKLLGETLTDGDPGPGVGVDTPVLPHPLTRNGSAQRNTTRSK